MKKLIPVFVLLVCGVPGAGVAQVEGSLYQLTNTGREKWGVTLNVTLLSPNKKLGPLLGFLWGDDGHCCDFS